MLTPKFNEEPLSWQLQEIERVNFRIERMLIMPKHEHWLQREAFVRTAYSSTMLENNTIPDHEMEEAAKLAPLASSPTKRPDLANYYAALEFVDFLSDSKTEADERVITQVHWFLMKGIDDTRLKPGQYRTEANWIEDRGIKVYEPPHHIDVPILMRELSVWLSEHTNVNPIVKAGIAHLHLVAVHPFVDGNGRAARLIATLLLQSHGYGFRKLLSLDAHYQGNRDKYIEALNRSLGKKFSNDYDSTAWLEFFVNSVWLEATRLEKKLTDWRMWIEEVHKKFIPLGLNERQVDGLIYAVRAGQITRKDYAEIARVSLLTASRDLANMVGRGILEPRGSGKGRKYIPSSEGQSAEGEQKAML